jgi:hypothetical protein
MERSVDAQALIMAVLSSAGALGLAALVVRYGFILIVIHGSKDKPNDAAKLLRAMRRNAPAESEADGGQEVRADDPGAARARRTGKRRQRGRPRPCQDP